jgi:hypothetical protein
VNRGAFHKCHPLLYNTPPDTTIMQSEMPKFISLITAKLLYVNDSCMVLEIVEESIGNVRSKPQRPCVVRVKLGEANDLIDQASMEALVNRVGGVHTLSSMALYVDGYAAQDLFVDEMRYQGFLASTTVNRLYVSKVVASMRRKAVYVSRSAKMDGDIDDLPMSVRAAMADQLTYALSETLRDNAATMLNLRFIRHGNICGRNILFRTNDDGTHTLALCDFSRSSFGECADEVETEIQAAVKRITTASSRPKKMARLK